MSLGRVVVDLLARTGSFETDLNRAGKLADRRAKEIDRAFKQAGRAIGLALVAATTAVSAQLKRTIDRMDDMSKAAQRAQLPTEQFSQLAHAASLADVSIQDLQTAFGRLAKAQGDSLKTTSEQGRIFKALGIDVADTNGKLRSTRDVFLEFADVFQKNKGSPEVMAAGMAIFGRSFQNLIPLLKDGKAGLEAAADEADRLGITLSTEAGRQAEEFNDNLTRLKTALNGLWQEVAINVLPTLIDLTDEFVESSKEGGGAKKMAHGLADGIRDIVAALRDLRGLFGVFAEIRESLAASDKFAQSIARATGVAKGGDFLKKQFPALYKPRLTGAAEDDAVRVQMITGSRGRISPRALRDPFAVTPDPDGIDLRDPPKTGGSKKSEAEREAERLLASYERLEYSLKEQAALMGETKEVAKLRYEIENGELSKLNQSQKDNLLGLAAEVDAERERQQLTEDGKRLIESLMTPTERLNELREEANKLWAAGKISLEQYIRAMESYKDPGQQMLDDLRFELELLKMTNAERATAIQLRGMDAEQVQKYGAAIAQANRDIEESLKQIDFMDGVRGEFEDFFVSLVDGSKSAGDAIKDLFDNIAAMVTRMIAERWVEQMFGQMGTTGAGTTGGDWIGKLFGAFFGGGRASGGPVGSGQTYLVGENGPELFVPRTAGTVIPAGATASMSGGTTVTQQIYVTGRVDARTAAQLQQEAAVQQRRATARNS